VGAAGLGNEGADEEPRGENGRSGREGRLPLELDIPDDARELDADVRSYRREVRRSRLKVRLRRLVFTRRWNRYGLSGPLVTAILVLVALVGSLATLLGPRGDPRPAPAPLASSPAATPGGLGGLLPAVPLVIDGTPVGAHALRPAVLVLVSPECGCEAALDELFRQAQEYRLQVLLVGGPADVPGLRRVAGRIGNGTARVVEDRTRALALGYGARGLTAVLVRTDGVVTRVHRGLARGMRLEPDLSRLPRAPR